MRTTRVGALLALMASSPAIFAQSLFDGTWRPDPQRPGPDEKPDVLTLSNGMYECQSCRPPYRVAADGQDHAVSGNPRFDTVAITIVDSHTVLKTARRNGAIVVESRTVVAADGNSKTETQTVAGVGPRPFHFAAKATRVTPAAAGSHALSGSWRVLEADLVNHDEDTTYRVADGTLTMNDRMGRSFAVKLDGTVAPYRGDDRYTGVAARWIDDRTIEESDRNGDSVVLVAQWQVEPDGRTMHVRFDDTHGHVMEQTGHKLP
jgi:hypothetical protein